MSTIPPFRQPTELEAEARKQEGHDAGRRAQPHSGGDVNQSPGPVRRTLQRLRALVSRRG